MYFYNFGLLPIINEMINRMIKIKKQILAIPAEAPAIPPNPSTPAINAITTNVSVQRNIIIDFVSY